MPNLAGLAGQASAKLSSTLSQAKSITSGLSSQASGLLQKGQSLLPSVGAFGGAAAAGLLTGVGVASFQSKFTVQQLGFVPPGDRSGIAPESIEDEKYRDLRYPRDTPKYWMKITFKKYERPGALEQKVDLPTQSVIFPMPVNLSEEFSIDYNTTALGAAVGTTTEIIQGLANKTLSPTAALSEITKGYISSAAVAGRAAITTALDKAGEGAIGEKIGYAIDKTLGTVANPHLAVIFGQVNLREHSFSYRFSPNNKEELDELKRIIKSIKKRILPTKDSAFTMGFPNTCDITFGGGDNGSEIYKIKKCVMNDFKINYVPQGSPAFFRTGDPVEVEITMSFKETEVHTSEDYRDSAENQSR